MSNFASFLQRIVKSSGGTYNPLDITIIFLYVNRFIFSVPTRHANTASKDKTRSTYTTRTWRPENFISFESWSKQL